MATMCASYRMLMLQRPASWARVRPLPTVPTTQWAARRFGLAMRVTGLPASTSVAIVW